MRLERKQTEVENTEKEITKTEKSKNNDKNKKSFAKEFLKEIVIAAAIAGAILFFVGPTAVREHSMQPTVNDGDVLLLSKALYNDPQVGDIIVFKSELEDDNGKPMNLIKRVIGTGGDIITITNGKLYRNGQEIKEDYIYGECTGEVYNFEVPEGKLYVLGDHREVSRDSRELGAIDEKTVIGKAVLRIWPLSDFGGLN